jgi:flagellar basal body P-ring formation protein FlgA
MMFAGRKMRRSASAVMGGLLACTLAANAASAARLRPYVEITGPVVHLSDLFAGLDAGQDVQLGAAPAPGSQLVVRGAQLGAIADEFGVSWDGPRDGVSATLLRRGHRIDSGTVTAKLHDALLAAGIDAKSIVTLDRFTAPMVDDTATITVEPPELDAARRRFRTVLRATCGPDEVLAMDLTGSVETAVAVVVPVRAIKVGEIIAPEDLTLAPFAESKVPANAVMRIDEAAGQEARMPLTSAAPIAETMLRRANLVHKGTPVAIHLVEGGIDIAAQGVALGSGALQDRVPVLNPSSRAVLFGWVIGDSEVRVDPGTRPTTPPPNMMLSYGTLSQ